MKFAKIFGGIGIVTVFLLWTPFSHARLAPENLTLREVLNHMDESAHSFRTLAAQVERTKVTAVVNERSTESGTIYVERDGKMRLDVDKPNRRTVLRTDGRVYIYTPMMSQVEEYDLAKHQEEVDQFLLLGFGTPGHEIEKAYRIQLGGEQTLDGKQTVLLNLTPESPAVSNQISQIQLWIDESNWLPVQQKFQEAGTPDYFTIRYTDIKRNIRLDGSLFKPHWPKGTKRVKPQG